MLFLSFLVSALPLVAQARGDGFRARIDKHHANKRKVHEAHKANQLKKRATSSTSRYYSNTTSQYLVTSMPEVNVPLPEMYAGNIPIDNSNPNRSLFSVFVPRLDGTPVDELVIWLNGGPGCSSLDGFFQENGPIVWRSGTDYPVTNPYTWANLTNVIWVDQPVGTGYSVGEVTATNQTQTAEDFVNWFYNWQQAFNISNYKIYVTGESYAGRYVPYISYQMIQRNDTTHFNLSGALTYDPCIGKFEFVQEELVAVPFVTANNNMLGLNSSFLAEMQQLHQQCGYADYIDKYLTFPASGVQPPRIFYQNGSTCDVFDALDDALLDYNPCFDIYEISQTSCPYESDVLGFPTQFFLNDTNSTLYFNRADVKAALHAPDVDWALCSVDPVFVYNGSVVPEPGDADNSPDPIQSVLPAVIEHTNRVLVGNGDLDMIIITNGTLLAIQNMTWNGLLGFQSAPANQTVVTIPDLEYMQIFDDNFFNGTDGAQGVVGMNHYERGLMWVQTFQSGHMQPEFQPRAAYTHLEWLLGRINDFSGNSTSS